MPSFAKIASLLIGIVSPTCLVAQTIHPVGSSAGQTALPSQGYSWPVEQASGVGPYNHAGLPLAGSAVVATSYEQPLAATVPVPPGGEPATAPMGTGPAVSLSPRSDRTAIPLSSPIRPESDEQQDRGVSAVITVVSSLAVVLGIFLLAAWGMHRVVPTGSGVLPKEAFEVLGRAPMANRQQVHLLRCGRKLVLVSVTPAGAETLTEITDPVEVDRLAGLCQQSRSNSATAAFRQVFGQIGAEGHRKGLFAGREQDTSQHEPFPQTGAGLSAFPHGLEDHNG